MSFGRKGLAPGQTVTAAPRPATRINPEADEIAARREAFLAAERARRAEAEDTPEVIDSLAGLRNAARPATRLDPAAARWSVEPSVAPRRAPPRSRIFGPPARRSGVLAYLFWFIAGQVSLHRFYCGQKDSALIQIGLFIGSLVVTFVFPPLGFVGLVAWAIWLFADLFLIPGMLRRFKAEHAEHHHFA